MKNEKNLKICKVIFSFSFLVFLFLISANFVFAQWGQPSGNWTSNDIVNIFDRAANYLFTFTIILAVIVFIWNGILFMTSGGQDQKITTARKALTWALVGVVIAIASKGIIMIVISLLRR